MERELKSIAVLQTGKVLAIIYGFFSVIMIPFLLIVALVSRGNIGAMIPTILVIVLYPVIGFIGGIIAAALYNLAASLVGGLQFTLKESGRVFE